MEERKECLGGTGRSGLSFWVGMAALFLALLALCWLFPVIGDDWYREEMGRNLRGPLDLLKKVIAGWQTYNGRIFGNILAYAAGDRKGLRELLRALFTLGTVYFAAKNAGARRVWARSRHSRRLRP